MCLHPTGVILNHPILTVTTLGVLKQHINEGCEYSRKNDVLPIPDISISSSWAEVTEELEFQMQRQFGSSSTNKAFQNQKPWRNTGLMLYICCDLLGWTMIYCGHLVCCMTVNLFIFVSLSSVVQLLPKSRRLRNFAAGVFWSATGTSSQRS